MFTATSYIFLYVLKFVNSLISTQICTTNLFAENTNEILEIKK